MGITYTLYNSNLCREYFDLGKLITIDDGEERFHDHINLVNYIYNQLKTFGNLSFSIVSDRIDDFWTEGFTDQEGKIPQVIEVEDVVIGYTLLVGGARKVKRSKVGVADLISDIYGCVESDQELVAIICCSK